LDKKSELRSKECLDQSLECIARLADKLGELKKRLKVNMCLLEEVSLKVEPSINQSNQNFHGNKEIQKA
jgi:hypothetical protein